MNLDPLKFVQDGYQDAPGEYPDDTRLEIAQIRKCHPELADWGDLALGGAWGDYSQDELDVNWCDWLIGQRDEEFIAYIRNK